MARGCYYHRYQYDNRYLQLRVTLNRPFRTSGCETFDLRRYVDRIYTDHQAYDNLGAKGQMAFPEWFLAFLRELRNALHIEELTCINNARAADGRILHIFVSEIRHGKVESADLLLASIADHLLRRALNPGRWVNYFVIQTPQLWRDANVITPGNLVQATRLGEIIGEIVQGGPVAVYCPVDEAAQQTAVQIALGFGEAEQMLGCLHASDWGMNATPEVVSLMRDLPEGVTPVFVTGRSQVRFLTALDGHLPSLFIYYEGMEVGGCKWGMLPR